MDKGPIYGPHGADAGRAWPQGIGRDPPRDSHSPFMQPTQFWGGACGGERRGHPELGGASGRAGDTDSRGNPEAASARWRQDPGQAQPQPVRPQESVCSRPGVMGSDGEERAAATGTATGRVLILRGHLMPGPGLGGARGCPTGREPRPTG